MYYNYSTIIITLVLSFAHDIKAASNIQAHHPHDGKIKPFKSGNPNITLDDKAIKILVLEEPYQVRFV